MAAKPKFTRPKEELSAELSKSYGFLYRSLRQYLEGLTDEAYRIATACRVALHDKKGSPSLFRTLGLEDVYFWDSGDQVNIKNQAPQYVLTIMRMTVGAGEGMRLDFAHFGKPTPADASQSQIRESTTSSVSFMPRLDADPARVASFVPFEHWWKRPILMQSNLVGESRVVLSRRGLILAMANKEGGAHVDKKLDAEYAEITRGELLGIKATSTKGEVAVGPAHQASAAQIGYELLKTIERWEAGAASDHGGSADFRHPTSEAESG